MNNLVTFTKKGKSKGKSITYEILVEGVVYDPNPGINKCICKPDGQTFISIKAALGESLIRIQDPLFTSKEQVSYDVADNNTITSIPQRELATESLPYNEKINSIYYMPVDQLRAQVFLVHGLIYPAGYEKVGLSNDFNDYQRQSAVELILFEIKQPLSKNQLLLKVLLSPDDIAYSRRDGNVLYLSYPLPISRLAGIEIPAEVRDIKLYLDGWVNSDIPIPRHLFSISQIPSFTGSLVSMSGYLQGKTEPINDIFESISKFDRYLGVLAFLRNADRYFSKTTDYYSDYPEMFFSVVDRLLNNVNIAYTKHQKPEPLILDLLDLNEHKVSFVTEILALSESDMPYILEEQARPIATEIYNRAEDKETVGQAFKLLFNKDYRSAIQLLQSPDIPDEAAILATLYKFSGRQTSDHRTLKQRLHEDWSNKKRALLTLATMGAYHGYAVMDARESSLYSVHEMILPFIEKAPKIKFHLETTYERKFIEALYQRAFFPQEVSSEASDLFKSISLELSSPSSGKPNRFFINDLSYSVEDLRIERYAVTAIGHILQSLKTWNKDVIDEKSEVGQYLGFKLFALADESGQNTKNGKPVLSYRISKNKVMDLIGEGKIDFNPDVLAKALAEDIKTNN